MNIEMVPFLDSKTGQVTMIPADELAPGAVLVEKQGIGQVWIEPDDSIRDAAYQHPPCNEEVRDFFRQIKESLDEVHPMTLEEWEDGFRRDMHPEREIAIWLHIAATYRRCTARRSYSLEQRRDFFNVILACSCNPRKHVLKVARFSAISRQEAEAAMRFFYSSSEGTE